MDIRKEQADDLDKIETVIYQAFENHPHHEAGAKPTEHLIVQKLRNDEALTLSLIACDRGVIVGHIAFSPVLINGEASNWYGLAPVSVVPEQQNLGIGSKLINEGINELQKQGAHGIVLLGEPEYYQRFGFKFCANLTLEGVPPEYFLALAMETDTPIPAGSVTYHEAFI